MEVSSNEDFKSLIGIISNEQKEKTEINEEKAAGISSNEVSYLRTKEDLRKARIQNDILEEGLNKLKQDRGQRKGLSYALFGFMCVYMFAVLIIVSCCGLTWMQLSDNVIITLLTTTLADVIGIFGFVAKYLYQNKS